MRRLSRSVGSGTDRFTVVPTVMIMAATGVVITIVTDSIAFPVSAGTAASSIKSILTGALPAPSLKKLKAALVAAFVFPAAAQTLTSLIAALFFCADINQGADIWTIVQIRRAGLRRTWLKGLRDPSSTACLTWTGSARS